VRRGLVLVELVDRLATAAADEKFIGTALTEGRRTRESFRATPGRGLGKEAWERELAAGSALTAEEALQLARSLAETTPKTPRTSGAASPQAILGG
jgi:hypothetical protein